VQEVSVGSFWMAQATVSKHDLELFSAQQGLRNKAGVLTARIAEAYAQWLSRATGKKYRLPTESELEYACIAGGAMPGWEQVAGRADAHVSGMAVVNAWEFFDLPGDDPEYWLDGRAEADGARTEGPGTGASFRVVRELEEKPATTARIAP
jgi:hypothetical protein